MDKKYLIEEDHDVTASADREQRINSLSLRTENELFIDEAYRPLPLYQVRYTSSPRKGEYWEILKDKEVFVKIPAERLTSAEKILLKSSDGMGWFLQQAKDNIKSCSELKRRLKERMQVKTNGKSKKRKS